LIGYHASHEQFSPKELLELVHLAESAGFEGVLSSDHFYPWSQKQGQSGFAWSWLGAAMNSTSFSFGIVTTPSYRYHPAILAQASATLAEMFPERFWLCLGSGELLNEGVIGCRWPSKVERNQRLKESVDIIRRLWKGENVTHRALINIEDAYLYTRPNVVPLLMGAALTPETARWLGGWADGLLTLSGSPEKLRIMINSFRQGGGVGKPVFLKVEVSYAPESNNALKGAWEQWKYNPFTIANAELKTPQMFDEVSRFLRPEDILNNVKVSNKSEEFVEWLKEFQALGVDAIYIHNVNTRQKNFIDFFGKEVIPFL
jgi:coenzyme F420-dependent glucose-6-phosphate dehydrogenase